MEGMIKLDFFSLENFKNFINIEVLPPLDTNCYYFNFDDNIIVVDPACKSEKLYKYIESRKNYKKYIILTHNHIDHINGVNYLLENFSDFNVVMHENDAQKYYDTYINGASYLGIEYENFDISIILDKNYFYKDELISKILKKFPLFKFYKLPEIEDLIFFTTPGHTAGSISFIYKNLLFTGDTLFQNGWGRTDLPSGDEYRIKESILLYYEIKENYLLKLENFSFIFKDFIVLPGHGDHTILDDEKDFLKEYLNLNI
ncbi:MAG: MBL fold metallo-hydrolase [Spirochaetes bacterium]|nr:MBL fold metallo-hydrolase [Spirochaetota bacterium]